MQGKDEDQARFPFPIQIQPGTPVGSWQVTFGVAAANTTVEFSSALDLLRWLERLENTKTPPLGGLR